MQRLGGIDSLFLNLESDTVPMHVAALMMLDARKAPRFSFERVRATLAARLHLLPPFRRRVVFPPLNLIRPYWVEDPDFRLGNHVLHHTLPAPGGRAELAALVESIIATRLDRSRPLWSFHYIDGLADGHVACVARIHHACADGISGAQLFDAVLDHSPDARIAPEPPPDWEPDELPSPAALAWATARSAVRAPKVLRHLIGETWHFGREFLKAKDPAAAATEPVTMARRGTLLAPRTRFNITIDAQRHYAWTKLPLKQLEAIKRAFGCSLNDVVLALCGDALRRYLERDDELPDAPLLAMIPMSIRARGEYGEGGNRVIMSRVSLATDIVDPVERLRFINRGMGKIKKVTRKLPSRLMMDWINMPAPALFAQAARLYENFHLQDYVSLPVNLVVSNVPGPRETLYFAGARLDALYPISIPYHGLGLNVTMMSYCEHLHVGLTSHPDAAPELDQLAALLRSACQRLHRAAVREKS